MGALKDYLPRHLAQAGAVVHEVLRAGLDSTAVTATTLITWRPARNLTLTGMRASLATASSSGTVTLDVRVNGVSILSTLEVLLQSSKTSVGGTDAVFADPDLTTEDEVTIVCTGAGTGATGRTVTLIGNETPVAFMDGLSLRLLPEDMRPFHTRASVAWAFNVAGVLTQYAANVLRVVPSPAGVTSALREPQSTNKCTNFNANPPDAAALTKGGDAAATLTLVSDAAALLAAGLGTVCASGLVYQLDNTAGVAAATASAAGQVGNLNQHTVSVFVRGGTGDIRSSTGEGATAFAASATYVRRVATFTPGATNRQWAIKADPGQILYFILNQLEEQPFVTTPIVGAGSAATRARDEINVPMVVADGQAFSHSVDFVIPHALGVISGGNRLTGDTVPGASIIGSVLGVWNGTTFLSAANAYAANTRGKGAWAADGSGRAVALNAGTVATDTNTFGAFVRRFLGQRNSGTDATAPILHIHEFRACRARLANNKLRRLTA